MLSDFVLGMLVSISNRLNPYSNGMLSDNDRNGSEHSDKSRLNPYSNGMLSDG